METEKTGQWDSRAARQCTWWRLWNCLHYISSFCRCIRFQRFGRWGAHAWRMHFSLGRCHDGWRCEFNHERQKVLYASALVETFRPWSVVSRWNITSAVAHALRLQAFLTPRFTKEAQENPLMLAVHLGTQLLWQGEIVQRCFIQYMRGRKPCPDLKANSMHITQPRSPALNRLLDTWRFISIRWSGREFHGYLTGGSNCHCELRKTMIFWGRSLTQGGAGVFFALSSNS